MKLEQHHHQQQHEAGTSTSINTKLEQKIINNMKLEHQHLYVATK
jgi:hypothetical protein